MLLMDGAKAASPAVLAMKAVFDIRSSPIGPFAAGPKARRPVVKATLRTELDVPKPTKEVPRRAPRRRVLRRRLCGNSICGCVVVMIGRDDGCMQERRNEVEQRLYTSSTADLLWQICSQVASTRLGTRLTCDEGGYDRLSTKKIDQDSIVPVS
ncbi:hypothetical protein BDZ97DRAFT_1807328 [Flammula alnicola]|nr:hypothetical protein BDZ97DRAFT_1807328 [Flammula alnicola]